MDSENDPAKSSPVVSSPEPEQASEPEPEPVAHHREPIQIGPRFYATLAVLLFVVAYSIAFIVGNDKTISVDFVFATARVSLIWMILLLLAVGVVGGVLLVELYRHRRSKHRREA